MKKIPKKKDTHTVLVNFKLHRNVVKVLDRLVESGLYKTRIEVVLSALRSYSPFQELWKREVGEVVQSSNENIKAFSNPDLREHT